MRSSQLLRPFVTMSTTLAVAMAGASVLTPSASAAADVGYVGPSYAGTTQPSAPSAQKPQSKLWYAHDRW